MERRKSLTKKPGGEEWRGEEGKKRKERQHIDANKRRQ